MKSGSRTHRTIRNSQVSLILFLIQIFIGFYSRKVFLDYLNAEVLGMNTTLGNILSFLNLAELGIGIAMSTSLYKPIKNDKKEEICDIISIQGYYYRKIAIILAIISVPVCIVLGFFFANTSVSLTYMAISFYVFLSGSLFSYLWNYRQVLIEADQKNYKLMPWIHAIRYTKIFLQIVFLKYLNLGMWGWIGMEMVGNVLTVFAINYVLKKEYPWLRKSGKDKKTLLVSYAYLKTKTKQVFVHKLGSFVLEQTAPLIIYAYVSLTMVTYYCNYMIIIGYAASMLNVIFEGMGASIGNLIAENNKKHSLDVFWELFTSRMWIAAIVSFSVYVCVTPFVKIWLGEQYQLSAITVLLMVIGMFIRITRSVIDSFKNAFQLFGDVWAPIAEASLNLGGSVLLGYFWGLNGILIGSNLSLVIIVLLWKPYYVFKNGFRESSAKYFIQYVLHLAIIIGCALLTLVLFDVSDSFNSHIWSFVFVIAIYAVSLYVFLLVFTGGMKRFTKRVFRLICKDR